MPNKHIIRNQTVQGVLLGWPKPGSPHFSEVPNPTGEQSLLLEMLDPDIFALALVRYQVSGALGEKEGRGGGSIN